MKPKYTEKQFKGILRIDTDENNFLYVVFEPIDVTVWLRKSELPSLFNVNTQTVNSCLTSILKENIIDVKEACKYDLYVCGNRIRHDVREVNLEVILAMAFRINSPQAKILREWFIGRCLKPGLCGFPLDMEQGFSLN